MPHFTTLYHSNYVSSLQYPKTFSADTTSSNVDLANYSGCMIVVGVGSSGADLSTDNKIHFEVQHGSATSSFAACADTDIMGNTTSGAATTGTIATVDSTADDKKYYMAEYIGTGRYVRVVPNFVGTHSGATPIGIIAVLGGARVAPQQT